MQCDALDSADADPQRRTSEGVIQVRKIGELRRCDCFAPSRPGVVLDPFFGTGTSGGRGAHGRDWLGIDLNADFSRLAGAAKCGGQRERGGWLHGGRKGSFCPPHSHPLTKEVWAKSKTQEIYERVEAVEAVGTPRRRPRTRSPKSSA